MKKDMKTKTDPLKQSQQAKRSNLADWWMNQFTELDLPSGLHVVVRDIDMDDLVANGSLPNTLLNLFPELEGMNNEDAGKKMMEEHPDSFKDLINAMATTALVEPKIGEMTDVANGVISLDDLRGKDKLFLFGWLQREAGSEEMRNFREGENKPVETA